jgi:hypothetical protein
MRTFTREELIEAYAQIERERDDEVELAVRAADWLQKMCRLGVSPVQPPGYVPNVGATKAPFLPEYVLYITQTQYSRPNAWLHGALSRPASRPGFPDGDGFWLDLGPTEGFPEGTRYYCAIDHVDAHADGY